MNTERIRLNFRGGDMRARHLTRLRCLVLFATTVVAACEHALTSPSGDRIVRATARNEALLAQKGHVMMLDELLEAVNDQASGFGGMYRSGRSTMTIFYTARGDTVSIEKAARSVFVDYPWGDISSVKFVPARFEVKELQGWRAHIHEAVGTAHLLWTDFDETSNVVRVGVDSSANLKQMTAAALAVTGAPSEAMVFEHDVRKQPLQSLLATHRPVVGGVQIAVQDTFNTHHYGTAPLCSFGFSGTLTNDQYDVYFVTAGHCSGNPWAYQWVSIFQPDSATNSTRIGYLWGAPPGSTTLSGCLSGYTCKYSDSELYIFSTGCCDFNFLAKDSSFSSSSITVPGSLFRKDSFQVTGNTPEADLLAADTVAGQYGTFHHKVGIATGWTFGPQIHTCVNRFDPDYANKMYLCQYVVYADADLGDSGSPVFRWLAGGNNVYLTGILVSGAYNAGYEFSSITGILNDIGTLGGAILLTHY